MNTQWIKLSAIALYASLLIGCGSKAVKPSADVAYTFNSEHSMALNYMLASKTMVVDGEIKDAVLDRPEETSDAALELQKSIQNRELVLDALDLVDGGSVLAGFSSPPVGISSGFHAGMMLLSFLQQPYQPSFVYSHAVAYMPENMASSPEEASAKLRAMLLEALKKSLPEYAEHKVMVNRWTALFGKQVRHIDVITGGACDKSIVHFYGLGEQPTPRGCELSLSVDADPDRVMSPQWLGEEASYFFHPDFYKQEATSGGAIGFWLKVKPAEEEGLLGIKSKNQLIAELGELSRESLMIKMTEHMPAWYYVYIAPTKQNPVPRIVTQGQTLYFAKWHD